MIWEFDVARRYLQIHIDFDAGIRATFLCIFSPKFHQWSLFNPRQEMYSLFMVIFLYTVCVCAFSLILILSAEYGPVGSAEDFASFSAYEPI